MRMRREAQACRNARNKCVDLMPRQSQPQFGAKGDRFVHGQFAVNDVVLRNVADSDFSQPRPVGQWNATEPHLAGGGRVDTAKRIQQRRLSVP